MASIQRRPESYRPRHMYTTQHGLMITTEYGKQNIFPNEPRIQLLQKQKLMSPESERFNGWAAMLGFVAAIGAYATTGQIIPGLF